MIHYTLNTGHIRMSPRSEVADDIIDVLRPIVEEGEHIIRGILVVVPHTDHGFVATIYADPDGRVPLCTIGVADTIHAEEEIWPCLEDMYLRITDGGIMARAGFQSPRKPTSLPWLAVVLHGALVRPETMEWLGDMERCLAWAWLEGRK